MSQTSNFVPCTVDYKILSRQLQKQLDASSKWQPIETAPKDNQVPLYLARFNAEGELLELDWDGVWEYWQESVEMSHINGYSWMSARGIEEPTHWAYQREVPPPPALVKP